jgi:hypothetical protein
MFNVSSQAILPPMSKEDIDIAYMAQEAIGKEEQVHVETNSVIHDGVYYRTIKLIAGTVAVGALIKVPTVLIVSGTVKVFVGNTVYNVSGYEVFQGEANRKQVAHAITDTYMTMCFKTDAKTIDEAEKEFTDEYEILISRKQGGELCQEL